MPTCSADQLRGLMAGLFEAVGTPAETAEFISNSLVAANLAGHDSHGVIRILQYIEVVESGALDPRVEPEIVSVDGATLKVDGKWGWGQPAFQLATLQTIELARQFGIAVGVVDRCFHVGRVAPYVETIARAGMIGLAMANAGPAVAPYGARTRRRARTPSPGRCPVMMRSIRLRSISPPRKSRKAKCGSPATKAWPCRRARSSIVMAFPRSIQMISTTAER